LRFLKYSSTPKPAVATTMAMKTAATATSTAINSEGLLSGLLVGEAVEVGDAGGRVGSLSNLVSPAPHSLSFIFTAAESA
jgi:hypothetical protein